MPQVLRDIFKCVVWPAGLRPLQKHEVVARSRTVAPQGDDAEPASVKVLGQ